MIPLAAVLGDPIAHSRSPRLHGHWLARYSLPGHYIPLHVRGDDLARTLELMPRLGFVGANVTLPHKIAVLQTAHSITPTAMRIGSANTLTFHEDGFEADNTDAYGFTWNILDHFPDWRPRRAAVLGAGGASRAIIVALQDMGATEIRLTNRSPETGKALAQEFGVTFVDWGQRNAALDGCDTLVNATSLGMTGKPPLEISLKDLARGALVTDLVYTPLETPLLAAARDAGHRVVDGLGMLLHQAVPGFERWFGVKPEVSADLRSAVLA